MTGSATALESNLSPITDLAFQLRGRSLPVEHAHGLSRAVLARLPWLDDEEQAGIHQVQVAPSANGWMRPDATRGEMLSLSRRTRLVLRLPANRLEDAQALEGATLSVDGCELEVGSPRPRALPLQPEQFARHVICRDEETEGDFLNRVVDILESRSIRSRKLLCGRGAQVKTRLGSIMTRSLLVASLSRDDARRLQATPLGEGRLMGCGLFIPHKGIAAVYAEQEFQ